MDVRSSSPFREKGIIAGLSAVFITWAERIYRGSGLSRRVAGLAAECRRIAGKSDLWRFFFRPERSTLFLNSSAAGRIMNAGERLSLRGLRAAGRRLESSLTGRFLASAAAHTAWITGTFVLIQTIVPHQYWFNIFNLVLSGLVFLLYLVRCATDRSEQATLSPLKLDTAMLIFFLAGAMAAVTSLHLRDSLRIFTLNLIPLLVVFVIVNGLKTLRDLERFMWLTVTGVTVASLYGFAQYAMGIEVDQRLVDTVVSGSIRRLFSTMGNPNNFGEYLVLTLPLYAALFLNGKTIRMKLLVAGLALLPLGNLFLTSSRSSWLGLVFAGGIFLFMTYRKLLPLLLLGGLLAIPVLPDSIRQRIGTIGRDSSSQYRVIIWKGAFRMLGDYWLTGTGQGPAPFMALFPRYSTLRDVVHSHMLPLQIWLETGLAGILSFLWMMGRLFKKVAGGAAVTENRSESDNAIRRIRAAAFAGMAGLLFIGIFEYVWFYPRILSMFWILAGLLMAALAVHPSSIPGGDADAGAVSRSHAGS